MCIYGASACVSCADDSSLREAFTDAVYFKDEALRAFKLGVLSLEERAEVCVPWYVFAGCQ